MCQEVTFAELLDSIEGCLAPDDARRVATHLAEGCSRCAEDVQWLQRVMAAMASDRLVDAPAPLVQRVQGLYPKHRKGVVPPLLAFWARLRGKTRMYNLVAAVLTVVLALAGSWWAWGNTSMVQAAVLAQVSGPVQVRPAGEADWQPAAPGMQLGAGSVLQSGEGATAVLMYPDGSRTYLTDQAWVEITCLSGPRYGGALQICLNQQAGHTQHNLATEGSCLWVKAAGAVAQARAADCDVWVNDSEVDVHAGRGRVIVQVNGQRASLNAGQHGRVAGGQLVVATPAAGEGSPKRANPSARGTHSPPGQEQRGVVKGGKQCGDEEYQATESTSGQAEKRLNSATPESRGGRRTRPHKPVSPAGEPPGQEKQG